MKKLILAILVVTSGLSACGNQSTQNRETMNKIDENTNASVFPLGALMPENFTGEVHYQPLVNAEDMENLYTVGQVTFSPGARTNWHTHPAGQVLLVTGGEGWYQERGNDALPLRKGTVINIPKDVEHWHGASASQQMVHIAISNLSDGNNVTWMTPVNDEEYSEVK